MQISKKNISIIGMSKEIIQQKGVRGLYYGLPAMLMQVSAKAAIRFFCFESYKAFLTENMPGRPESLLNLLSGLGAGVTESLVWVAPTERLKVLRMTDINNPTPKYNTLIGGLRTVVAEQGVRGIFTGFTPTAMRQGTSVAIRFMVYDDAKRLLTGGHPENINTIQQLGAGFLSGCCSTCFNQPLDVVKTRIQSQGPGGRFTGTFNCLSLTFREEGFLALYKGILPRILKVGSGQAITFCIYDQVSAVLTKAFSQNN